MMDQTRIGYTGWQQPPRNIMPKVEEVTASTGRQPSPPMDSGDKPRPAVRTPKDWRGFVEQDGYVSIEAVHFTHKTDTATARWEILPDHGRSLSSMTIFPVTAPSVQPPENSPHLEYQMWLTSTGSVTVTTILSPCLNFNPGRGVQIATSFDDESPTLITVVPKGYTAGDGNRDWEESVKDSVRHAKSTHHIASSGAHTFKVWMVDPAVVVQKIVVDCGGAKPSYLGPPESFRPKAR